MKEIATQIIVVYLKSASGSKKNECWKTITNKKMKTHFPGVEQQ